MNQQNDQPPYQYFRMRVYEIVQRIPPGRVITYGRIAENISQPPGMDPLAFKRIRARWVGYAMKSCPEGLPWWRVVNKQGKISLRSGHGPHIQPEMLKEEGVQFDSEGRITLDEYLWEMD